MFLFEYIEVNEKGRGDLPRLRLLKPVMGCSFRHCTYRKPDGAAYLHRMSDFLQPRRSSPPSHCRCFTPHRPGRIEELANLILLLA
jgi:hypothetical protein